MEIKLVLNHRQLAALQEYLVSEPNGYRHSEKGMSGPRSFVYIIEATSMKRGDESLNKGPVLDYDVTLGVAEVHMNDGQAFKTPMMKLTAALVAMKLFPDRSELLVK